MLVCRPFLALVAMVGCCAGSGCLDRAATPAERSIHWNEGYPEPSRILRLDLVVLVDNSGSMAEEQVALTLRFPELIEELVNPPVDPDTGRLDHAPVDDLNIGVITPDMGTAGYTVATCGNPDFGDNGCFRNTPSPAVAGCTSGYPSFLARNPANLGTYSSSQLAQDFTCIAMLGTNGCGWEQPLAAMRRAVTEDAVAGGCNSGFLRPDSVLALLFVTDEDDCSVRADHVEMFDDLRTDLGHINVRCILHPDFLDDVAAYVGAFRALRLPEQQDEIFVGMIVGVPPDVPACTGFGDQLFGCLATPAMQPLVDPSNPRLIVPSCDTEMGEAFAPVRFVRLAESLGPQAYVASICQSDWTAPLRKLARAIAARIPGSCFPQELDWDPATCDVPSCVAIETLSDDRECARDPSCPPEWCLPTTAEDARNAPPCVDPTTGALCVPLKRDLGLVEFPSGGSRRQCLVRQAALECVADRCGGPLENGWYYLPTGALDPGPPPRPSCPQIGMSAAPAASLIEVGSTAEFRCLAYLCPEERQCGPAGDPAPLCCPEGQVCDTPSSCSHPRAETGVCVPAG
jgi:hypothetical protein